MRSVGGGDKILWIQDKRRPIDDVLHGDRIHVVDHQPSMDLIASHAQIASVVSKNNDVSNVSPFGRSVKPLVDPSIRTKGLFTNLATKVEIAEALFECLEPSKLSVSSNLQLAWDDCSYNSSW